MAQFAGGTNVFVMEYIDSAIYRIPARSRRQVMDWSLVLLSQGIESTIDRDEETGWCLIVAASDRDRSRESIQRYQTENRHWPWRQEIPSGILFDWGSVGWALLLCLFFYLSERWPDLRSAGVLDGIAVNKGEWWRISTATFLHADAGHLAANVGIGVVLLGLVMGRYGTGLGLFATYLAGVGGNLMTWLVHRNHESLGASGMVMGCMGLLGAQTALRSANPHALKSLFRSVGGAFMLFVLFGLNPETDVSAHAGGFLTGIFLGSVMAREIRNHQNTSVNLLAGIAFCALVILTWGSQFVTCISRSSVVSPTPNPN